MAFVFCVVLQYLHGSEFEVASLSTGDRRAIIKLPQLLANLLDLMILIVLTDSHAHGSLPEVRIIEHVSVTVARSNLVACDHTANPCLHLNNEITC